MANKTNKSAKKEIIIVFIFAVLIFIILFSPKATNFRRILYNTGTFTFMARKR